MKIQARRPYQIVHDGKRHNADTGPFDAPDIEAKRWIRIGLAEKAVRDVEVKRVRQSDTRDKAVKPDDVSNKAAVAEDTDAGDDKLQCDVCGRIARSEAGLAAHKRSHE